jgi:hypothetical protein
VRGTGWPGCGRFEERASIAVGGSRKRSDRYYFEIWRDGLAGTCGGSIARLEVKLRKTRTIILHILPETPSNWTRLDSDDRKTLNFLGGIELICAYETLPHGR